MRGEEDGTALIREDGREFAEDFAASDRIEADGGLVEDEQPGSAGES